MFPDIINEKIYWYLWRQTMINLNLEYKNYIYFRFNHIVYKGKFYNYRDIECNFASYGDPDPYPYKIRNYHKKKSIDITLGYFMEVADLPINY